MVISEWLKAGILSIELAEGVNGCVRYYEMGRVGETEWRACRSARA